MKIYIVFKNNFHGSQHILKSFLDLDKALDYAADFVMTRTNRYEHDYIKKTMLNQYDDSTLVGWIFVYTHYGNVDIDEFVGIQELDVDE